MPEHLAVDGVTSAYEGMVFSVQIAPVAGSLGGCSQPVALLLVVTASGLTTPVDAATLIDQPAGASTSCVYDVSFPATSAVTAGGRSVTFLRAETDALSASTIWAADPTIVATYRAGETRFEPDIRIEIDGDEASSDARSVAAGATFEVNITPVVGTHGGCSVYTEVTFTVDADGNVTRGGQAVVLVDRPAGQDEHCLYDVTFPVSASGTAGAALVAASSNTITTIISADRPTATATYTPRAP